MRRIYTTEKVAVSGVEVLPVEMLSPSSRQWVERRRKSLMMQATLPERIAARMLSRFDDRPVRQAFFMIRDRGDFLDFFFPKRMVAVEIDGSSHKSRKDTDRRRDADFRSIGIRTIRVKNSDVMEGKLYEKIFNKLYR